MYARYFKRRLKGKDHFEFVEKVCLFGCNDGFIPWLLSLKVPPSQGEPYKWHIGVPSELDKSEAKYRGSTLVIDLKPKQNKQNLSLYEMLDVWGYSDQGWTPIMLRLSGLFVDVDPRGIDRHDFLVKNNRRHEPVYDFLYLAGTVAHGKLIKNWSPPPASPTNAALLFPDTLRYFVECIRRCTPGLI